MKSLDTAVAEAHALALHRDWQLPSNATVKEAERLLELVSTEWPAPEVQAQADGAICLDWEAGAHGWLTLTVTGQRKLEHAAVIDGDEYGLTEDFADVLPGWAQELLRRLHQSPARTLQ